MHNNLFLSHKSLRGLSKPRFTKNPSLPREHGWLSQTVKSTVDQVVLFTETSRIFF